MGPAGDAFDVLEIEPKFDLDVRDLSERHRRLSLALHPDRFAGHAAQERRLALERAMQVNAAYRLLRDPVQRAEALLRRRGVVVTDGGTPSLEFLETTLERREALSEAVLAGERARVEQLLGEQKAEQEELLARLSGLFEKGENGESGDGKAVAEILSALRYAHRFLEAAEAELEALP